jgi:RsiG-like
MHHRTGQGTLEGGAQDMTEDQDAAARRAERKRARLAAPPPDRDDAFAGVSLSDLRLMRDGLAEEETRVSYWRRIVQARMDVIRTEAGEGDRVADLGRVLADARGSHRRLAHISVEPVEGLPPLPDLARLWAAEVDPDDSAAREGLLDRLAEAESRLSDYRRELHGRIDKVTAELIARYREDPRLALSVLPGSDG